MGSGVNRGIYDFKNSSASKTGLDKWVFYLNADNNAII
jgi:hypothetical protein